VTVAVFTTSVGVITTSVGVLVTCVGVLVPVAITGAVAVRVDAGEAVVPAGEQLARIVKRMIKKEVFLKYVAISS